MTTMIMGIILQEDLHDLAWERVTKRVPEPLKSRVWKDVRQGVSTDIRYLVKKSVLEDAGILPR